ncbi:tetratricopeptide repeat protein [Actinomadura fibrosa]|uniref:tetratricopeptide repeat protein n=1 Tax=Actinomadura fibrosa TaxID=111802 RepID=UPI0013F15879|nr:tetratricopeptide repeat protein [Actinomadura fibrosa]
MSEQVRQEADVRRLADVRAGAGQSVKCSGTGYLVGPSLVLTCRHVLVNACAEHAERAGTSQGCGQCDIWPQLQVRIGQPVDEPAGEAGGGGPEPVRVGAWLLWEHPSQDVALLRLASPVPGAREWSPVRWGRLVTGATQRYNGLGFPRLARYADKTRFIEPLAGEVNQLSRDPDGFALNQTHGPRDDPSAASPWVGVSGAAVFVESWLLAVVTVDDRRSHNRLRAIPVTRCLQDPEFVRLVAADGGFEPVPEPVELAEVLQARPAARAATPGSLLAAAAEAVPFQGRVDHLRGLALWRDGGPADAVGGGAAGVSVRLVTGEGGQGKTRLARRFAADSRAAGWVAGFTVTAPRAASDAQQQAGAEQLAALLRACIEPVLVVCDYAETSPLFVETLLTRLQERPPARPVRVLLLARASGAWWQDLQDMLGDQAARLVTLPPLGDDPGVRREGYLAAVRGLAAGLSRLPEPAVPDAAAERWPVLAGELAQSPPDLSPEFGNALTLQMTALLDLLQLATGHAVPAHRDTGRRPEQQLAQHERDYHRRVAAGNGLLERDVLSPTVARRTRERHAMTLLNRALAGLIMLGPCDSALAAGIGALAGANRVADVVEWLTALYPPPPHQGDGHRAIAVGEVQPDRLAEILLGDILSTVDDPSTGPPTALSSEAGAEQLLGQIAALVHDLRAAQQALFALVRTAAHPQFRDALSEQTIDLIATHPDPFAAAAPFLAAIPAHRDILLAGLHRLGDRDPDSLTTQAGRTSALLPKTSVSLAHLSAAITGILTDLFRTLARTNRDVYLPDLAMSLNNYAVRLAETGRRAEAVPVSEEAVRLRRELTGLNRDAYLPNLAMSLNNYAALLAETGRRAEAVPVSEEAVAIYRGKDRAAAGSARHLPDLGAGPGRRLLSAGAVPDVVAAADQPVGAEGRDPRLEPIAEVLDVVEGESGAGQRPPLHRQEVHQERRLVRHRRGPATLGDALLPAPGRGLLQRAVNLAVVDRHRQRQPPLQLRQRQRRGCPAVVGALLSRIGERGARQLVDHLHHRANEPLDDPAEVRLPRRPVRLDDPVLLTTPPQRLALELRRVVHVDLARLSQPCRPHRCEHEYERTDGSAQRYGNQEFPKACATNRITPSRQ